MDKASEEQLKAYFEGKLKEQYQKGLAIGVKTVSKLILDKLNDSSLSLMDRITKVKQFCNSPFATNKKPDEAENTKEEVENADVGESGDVVTENTEAATEPEVETANEAATTDDSSEA